MKNSLLAVHIDEKGDVNVGPRLNPGVGKVVTAGKAVDRIQSEFGEAIKKRFHKIGEVKINQDIPKLRKEWEGKREQIRKERIEARLKEERPKRRSSRKVTE